MVEQLGTVRIAAYELRAEHLFVVRARVTALCLACRHQGPVDVFDLLRWGKYELLGRIEARLRCTQCEVKGFCHLRIEWER